MGKGAAYPDLPELEEGDWLSDAEIEAYRDELIDMGWSGKALDGFMDWFEEEYGAPDDFYEED